jgi:peptide chain release factor 1
MIDKLEQVEIRFEKVNELICLQEVVSDQNQYKDLMRELKNLTPIIECFRAYKEADKTEKEAGKQAIYRIGFKIIPRSDNCFGVFREN